MATKWPKFITAMSIPRCRSRKMSLCGFARLHLARGQQARVTVDIPAERFRCWDTASKQYVVESGNYELLIGAASDDIRLRVPLKGLAK